MNTWLLLQTLVVALLVGGSIWHVARSSLAGIRAASTAKTSGCGGCNACGGCPASRE